MDARKMMKRAQANGTVIPAFNIPFPPMMKPITQAVRDENCIAIIQAAQVEWEKFESVSLEHIADEYGKYAVPGHTLLHMDHVPVLEMSTFESVCMPFFKRAIKAGYQSVMVDGSPLPMEENIAVSRAVSEVAHVAGVAVEAEFGSIMATDSVQQSLSYEEIFERRLGFTEVKDAVRFAKESGCDWLSVAVGSIHGSIADSIRDQKKPAAKLDIERIAQLRTALNMPLVLHGGTGIERDYILKGIHAGISKINIGTELRQPYERAMRETGDVEYARECVYIRCREVIRDFLNISNNAMGLKDWNCWE